MSLSGQLLLAGLLIWSLALLRTAVGLLDTSAVRGELLRAGLNPATVLPMWGWLRVACGVGAAIVALGATTASWPPESWWSVPVGLVALSLGWWLPAVILNRFGQIREQRLGKEVAALVERVAVGLLCGADPNWALARALARGRDPELGKLMAPLLTAQAASKRPQGRVVGRHGRAHRRPELSSRADIAAVPAALRGLARVLRPASQANATEFEVQCLKLTLLFWSRGYASGAYDCRITPPVPRIPELEVNSDTRFKSM